MPQKHLLLIVFGFQACCLVTASAGDWPQFLRDARHTGDAAEEILPATLHCLARVALEDAVLTSPAVVGGRVYVVDQMGAAYCIDPVAEQIVWKSSPETPAEFGSNTSSPCVVGGKVFYGTAAGKLQILNCEDGRLVRSVSVDWPILDAITCANESVYFQPLNGAVYCLDLQGNTRWVWDPYQWTRAREIEEGRSPRTDGTSAAYFAGNPVAVAGDLVVTAIADDLVCLRDRGTAAELVWKIREPAGGVYSMLGPSICGEWVYVPCPGKDGNGAVLRVALKDGSWQKDRDVLLNQWAALNSAAVRDETLYFGRGAFGVSAYDFRSGSLQWTTIGSDAAPLLPLLSAPALSRQSCCFTTLEGEFVSVPLPENGGSSAKEAQPLFRWQTPGGRPISSSPAIADGRVYFGCDDGCLYVLGTGPATQRPLEPISLHRSQSAVTIAGQRGYAWPSAYGGPDNANFIDDPGLTPPFRLRYALRSGGQFKHPVCTTLEDVVYVTLEGLVVCAEQETGRLRWRRKLPHQVWTRASLLCAQGKVFVARMFSQRYPKVKDAPNTFYCLDLDNGEVLWQQPLGIGDRLRSSPVYADGVVAYGSLHSDRQPAEQFVSAWDASTGKPLWQIAFHSSGTMLNGPAGCAGEGVMYFTGGGESGTRSGETMAILPRSGKILWRTSDAYASQTGTPSYRDGRLYLPGAYRLPMFCLSTRDGSAIWKQDAVVGRWHVETVSLGRDFFTVNNKYKGGAWRWNLSDGSIVGTYDQPVQLWGPAHGCGAIVLASEGFALSATLEGLFAVDCQTGQVLWKSPGFASWTCPNPIASNGRIFYCPQVNGTLFCFEPLPDQR